MISFVTKFDFCTVDLFISNVKSNLRPITPLH